MAEKYLSDLFGFWKEVGPAALRHMQSEDNTKFCQMVAGVIPRDMLLTVEADASPFADMSPEQKRAIAMKLYESIEAEAKVIEGEVEPSKE